MWFWSPTMYLGISIMIKVKVRDAKLKPKLMRQQWRLAVVLGFLEIDDTSCSQAECVIAPPKTWCDCCQQSHWRYVYMSICCVVYCHVCSIGHAHLPYCRQCFATWAFPRVGSCTWKHKFHCRTEKEEKRKRIHVGTFSLLSVMFCNMSISRVEGCTWKHEFHCRREEEEKRNNISQAQIIPILICLEQKLVFCASENKTGFLCSGNKTGFLCFWERLQAPQTDRQTDRDLMKELQVLSSPSLPCCVILQQKVPWN